MADKVNSCPVNFSPIIKVVGSACNLRCKYCYYEGRHDEKLNVMSIDTAKTIISKFAKYSINNSFKQLKISWHGGEPLLAGLNFYKEIFDWQKKAFKNSELIIKNGFQTNATLINEQWIDLIKKYNIGIGISIDGPEELHNQQREHFKKTMAAINLLKKNKIKFGSISVITKNTLMYPTEKFFTFLHDLEANKCSLNKCTYNSSTPFSLKHFAINHLEYSNFLLKILDKWIELDDPKFMLSPLDSLIKISQGQKPHLCIFCGNCFKHIVINFNGDIYLCHEEHDKTQSLGNILSMEVSDITKTNKSKQIINEELILKNFCKHCKWYNFCYGGCKRDRIFTKNFLSNIPSSDICKGRKKLFEIVKKRIDKLI